MKYNHFGGVNEEGAIAEMEITFFTACDLEKVGKNTSKRHRDQS